MKKINVNTRIIGRSADLLILTNDPSASLTKGFYESAFVVEASTGKHLTDYLPLNSLLRTFETVEWVPENKYYDNLNNEENQHVISDGLIGFAIGDALGVPVEFLNKEMVRSLNVQEMMGLDTHMNFQSRWSDLIPAGAWSDDTSMIYATMDSMIRKMKIDYTDIMKSYDDWWTKGKYTSLSFPFGLGRTVGDALQRYKRGTPALECGGKDVMDNGNGALMRILPFSLYCMEMELSEEETAKIISEGSAITHGHDISKMSCFIYTEFMKKLIETKNPMLALKKIQNIDYNKYFSVEAIKAHKRLLKYDFMYIPDEDVNGSGYVVDSLECAIYSIIKTNNYEEAVKMAINTGYDTDTIAGITGSLAGCLYGETNIPERWKSKLLKKKELDLVALKYECFLDLLKRKGLNEMFSSEKKIQSEGTVIKH